jgi:hypothetical protein
MVSLLFTEEPTMKLPALLAAAALVCGSAFAAQDHTTPGTSAAATQSSTGSGPNLVEKAKRGLHRMGNATRNTLHRIGNAGHHSDTRSMGAAGSDDAARRSRMDDAYGRWSSRHNK